MKILAGAAVFAVLVTLYPADTLSQPSRAVYERSFGVKGTKQGQLSSPGSIAADLEGNLYVADTGNNRVQKFTSGGRFVKLFGGFGWNSDQFDEPSAVEASYGLHVVVVDRNNHRLTRLDRNLNFISTLQFDNLRNETYRFRFPVSAAVTAAGETFIADSENNKIVKFNTSGEPELQFGGYGTAGVPLAQPADMVVYDNKLLYISDTRLHAVFVYDLFGNAVDSFGEKDLSAPAGLAAGPGGMVYVCDPAKHAVLVFDSRGRMQYAIEHPQLSAPVDAAVSNGRLYVLDRDASVIHVFSIGR